MSQLSDVYLSCEERTRLLVAGYTIKNMKPGCVVYQGDLPYTNNNFAAAFGHAETLGLDDNNFVSPTTITQADYDAHHDQLWDNPGHLAAISNTAYLAFQWDDHEWTGDNWAHTLDDLDSGSAPGWAPDQEEVNRQFSIGRDACTTKWTALGGKFTGATAGEGAGPEYPSRVLDPVDYTNFGNIPLESEYGVFYWREYFDANNEVTTQGNAVYAKYFLDCITHRNPTTDPDTITKTLLGSIQLAWFIARVKEDHDLGTIKAHVVYSTKRWYLTNPSGNGDTGAEYSAEIDFITDELWTYGVRTLCILSGDQHRMMANSQAGRYPNIVACPVGVAENTDLFDQGFNGWIYTERGDANYGNGHGFGIVEYRENELVHRLVTADGTDLKRFTQTYGSELLIEVDNVEFILGIGQGETGSDTTVTSNITEGHSYALGGMTTNTTDLPSGTYRVTKLYTRGVWTGSGRSVAFNLYDTITPGIDNSDIAPDGSPLIADMIIQNDGSAALEDYIEDVSAQDVQFPWGGGDILSAFSPFEGASMAVADAVAEFPLDFASRDSNVGSPGVMPNPWDDTVDLLHSWIAAIYVESIDVPTGSPTLTTPYDNQEFTLNAAVNLSVSSNWSNIVSNSFTVVGLPAGLSLSSTGTITGNMRVGGIIDCSIHVVGIDGSKLTAGFRWMERL